VAAAPPSIAPTVGETRIGPAPKLNNLCKWPWRDHRPGGCALAAQVGMPVGAVLGNV